MLFWLHWVRRSESVEAPVEMTSETPPALPAAWFERLDGSPDDQFYRVPRFVQHIDEATIKRLSDYYAERLFAGADVLDLMSSWVSHLPSEARLGRVSGLGMNHEELAANPRLRDFVVHDLNQQPQLPYEADSFDFVLIAVSVQYLINPVAVISDIARVLRNGGQLIVAMSHRCFPSKAVRRFHEASGDERLAVITAYLKASARPWQHHTHEFLLPGADPLWIVEATKADRA